jgi:tripartite-type tricarboxylate transporter receptor subunit TctC
MFLSVAVCAQPQMGAPGNPIRIVVPYPPASSGDSIARRLAPKLAQEMGNTIIIENRQGANGNIGMFTVAKAKPDGYTFILASDIQFAVVPVLFQNLPYDVDRDFEPVGPAANIDLVIAAYPGLPANNLQELVALAKKKPGQISFASTGIGSTHQLFMELLKMKAGIDMIHVPYAGTGPAIPNLISGEVQMMLLGVPQAVSNINGGRLKPLAVGALQRLPMLPNVPTISESGFPGFEANNVWGVWAPAKTPDAVVKKMRAALVKVTNDPEIKEWYASQGLTRMDSNAVMVARLASDRKKWAEVIKANNIKPAE